MEVARLPPYDPRIPRGYREGSHDTTRTGFSQSHNGHKIKREDIGVFDTTYDDPDDIGLVINGKTVIFTDVYAFINRIKTFMEKPQHLRRSRRSDP
jgi:hypothetical protein